MKCTIKYFTAVLLILCFSMQVVVAQEFAYNLPGPTEMITEFASYSPPVLQGIKIHPEDPLKIDFIMKNSAPGSVDKDELQRIMKYFVAGLTVPEEDIWVNLSPYEADRVIEDTLSQTDLGRDLLAQDYVLKQISSSLKNPVRASGKSYWDEFMQMTGYDNLSFDKVWISSDVSDVYEQGDIALIGKSRLKVFLDNDLFASAFVKGQDNISDNAMRNNILPLIEEDVNNGKNFARLRQIYHALILAKWFKLKFKNSFYKSFINVSNVKAFDTQDPNAKQRIYQLYAEAFKKGMFNHVAKVHDKQIGTTVKRQYTAGGVTKLLSKFKTYELNSSAIGNFVNDDLTVYETRLSGDNSSAIGKDLKGMFVTFAAAVTAAFMVLGPLASESDAASNSDTQVIQWLNDGALFDDGMPHSYIVPDSFTTVDGQTFTEEQIWKSMGDSNSVEGVIERIMTKNTMNIYDMATWQIALTSQRDDELLDKAFAPLDILEQNSWGEFDNLRGDNFNYNGVTLDKTNSSFFRTISPIYLQSDPLDGKTELPGFPEWDAIHHVDWNPVTGENAWGAIIGPLHIENALYSGKIPNDAQGLKIAKSILPAVEALQSDIGAVYYSPGVGAAMPTQISNENNFSVYAALNLLNGVESNPRIKNILEGQLNYFTDNALHRTGDDVFFLQGGDYRNGKFTSNMTFAVDCQTWGISALGPKLVDDLYGAGTAYNIWKTTKRRAGYMVDGVLNGVGFTDGHDICSVEWTAGAILAARDLAEYYKDINPDWAQECLNDAQLMRTGIEEFRVTLSDGSAAYLYANKRYYIPFGWWANPIPSMAATSWVTIIDSETHPFKLKTDNVNISEVKQIEKTDKTLKSITWNGLNDFVYKDIGNKPHKVTIYNLKGQLIFEENFSEGQIIKIKSDLLGGGPFIINIESSSSSSLGYGGVVLKEISVIALPIEDINNIKIAPDFFDNLGLNVLDVKEFKLSD